MYEAEFDGEKTKVFWSGVHIETRDKKRSRIHTETWSKKVSLECEENRVAHGFDCKCLDCVVGTAVTVYKTGGKYHKKVT